MKTLTFVNESKILNQQDFNSIQSALSIFVDQVSNAWNLETTTVGQSPTRSPNGWNVCIVDKFPNPTIGAYGYHEVLNGQPIAYIRADSFATAPLGKFRKGLSFKGKVISKDRYQ